MSAPRSCWRRLAAGLVLGGLLVVPAVSPVLAEDLQEQIQKAQQQRQEMQQKAKDLKGELGSLEEKADEAQAAWRQAQSEHESAWNEYLSLKGRQTAAEQELQQTEAELAKVVNDLSAKQKLLATRLRALYVDGRVDYLSVLFGSTSIGDFLSRFELLRSVVQQDSVLVAAIKQSRTQVEAKQTQVRRRRDELTALTRQAAERNNTAATRKADAGRLEKEYNAKVREVRAALDQLDRDSQRLAEQIQALEREARRVGQLALRFPVEPVTITDDYGMRWHPITGEYRMHNGTDFAARMGQAVHAAEDGVVLVADWEGSYGNAVIISHGNLGGRTVSTLYAHNSELLVSPGQQVKRGDVIARAGSTGWSTGPHCHFEVRVNGTPDNPLDWLPKL